ncbi:hypothetical protein Tco_1310133 [Tanacetum coccineum]
MIKNGGNGSFRIIREQSIAAYKGYRGGGGDVLKLHDVSFEAERVYSIARSQWQKFLRVVIQDTLSAPKSKPATSKTKLKGAPSLTPQEQEAANIMQALKESKKTSRRQPGTRGSNEGTGSKLGVLDESTVISATSSEGTGIKPGVPDEEKDIIKENEDVEIKDVEGEESNKGEEKVTDAAKEEDEKTSEAKDDAKKTELPSSSLSLSRVRSCQISHLTNETPQTQSPSVQTIPVSVIPETTNLQPIPEFVTETPVLTIVPSPQVTPIILTVQQTTTLIPTPTSTTDAPNLHHSYYLNLITLAVELRVTKLEKDVSELKTVDHTSEALAVLQSQVPIVIDSYLDTKVRDVFQKEL